MSSITRSSAARPSGPRFDLRPGRVRYSRRWLGAGASLGLLAGLAVRRVGLPALGALGLTAMAGAAYTVGIEPRRPELTELTLRLPGLPAALDGLRVGQISDMHLGQRFAAENTAWAVGRVMAARPDLIALTGDFVSFERAIGSLPVLLAPLRAPLGVYAVPGNHDYWEGLPEVTARLAEARVELLLNRGLALGPGGALYVAGVDDVWAGRPDLGAALAARPAGAFTLLLAHAPDTADEAAAHGVGLQLSGHTHGGHLRLPLLGAFCLPRHGWSYPIGHEHVGPTQLYVSRGIGGLPLRLLCRPEASVFTLRRG